jgi:hypothetical protein
MEPKRKKRKQIEEITDTNSRPQRTINKWCKQKPRIPIKISITQRFSLGNSGVFFTVNK